MKPTKDSYIIERQPMISGQGEAQSRQYHMHVGKSGRRWLVAVQEAAAENIYVEGGPNSDGFGGATLTFPIEEGEPVVLKGPWHANADSLFQDTGIDVRDRHRTFVVVAKDRHYENGRTILTGILHKDPEPQLGSFHRGDLIAREIARKLDCPVILYSQSSGGSSCGPVKPDDTFYWEK